MDQIQEYHNQYLYNYPYENAYIDPQLLQLNSNSYSAGQNYSFYSSNVSVVSDDFSEITCADCLTTHSPTWRIRQDGKRVCNACGLYRRKYGSKRPLEVTREGRIRIKRRNIYADQPKICANCGTNESTCWRRVGGKRHCNACGLHAKIKGKPRRFNNLNRLYPY